MIRTSQTRWLASSEDGSKLVNVRSGAAGGTNQKSELSDMIQIIYSAGRQFYAVPDVRRECGLWLSVETHAMPVPSEWRRPDSVCVCVMRGRDYYRIGMFRPAHTDGSEEVSIDDQRVKDYRDAAWWTPGLEEAWVELQALGAAERSRANESASRGAKPKAEHQESETGLKTPRAKTNRG